MKRKTKIVLIIITLAVILAAFVGGQVYAKYMSRVTGNGVAEIACWNFKVNENEETMQTISLNSTINNITLAQGKVAPGTLGEFQIKIDATGSDAEIYYNVDFANETRKPNNLRFIYNGEIYNSLANLKNVIAGTIFANDENKQRTITLGWEWPYETGTTDEEKQRNNILDTQDAKEIQDYTFDIIVTGTQDRPEAPGVPKV